VTSRHFDVDLPGLLRVFGGHLYSSPGVFARELVQNAVDALTERRRVDPSFSGTVRVRGDAAAGVVEVEDDGVGLTEERIATCFARIGYSSKTGDDGVLGRFGIGLLSSFLVARELVAETRREGAAPVRFRATRDGAWTTEPGAREAPGTTVRLALDPEHRRYAERATLRALLEEHARYLPFTVEHDGEVVTRAAPWLEADAPSAVRAWLEAQGRRALSFFPVRGGCLFVTAEPGSAEGGRIDVYAGGMLLERGARRLLPRWATFVSGVVEARDLSPTASRETFVDDEAAGALREEIRRALLAGLSRLAEEDRAAFHRVLVAHYLALRGACVDVPELMDAMGDLVPFDTNVGQATLRELTTMHPERVLRYVETPQDFAHTAPIANAQGLALLNASYVHDEPFLKAWGALRRVSVVRFSGAEVALFVQPAPELLARFARVLGVARRALEPFDVVPEIGRFEPSAIPAFLASEATRTKERARSLVKEASSPLSRALLQNLAVVREAEGTRFVLNVASRLVAALPDVADEDRVLRVVRLLYVQASMVLRRTLSLAETRAFGDDLLALAQAAVMPPSPPREELN
jgi:molecular chaperone HtpG